MYYNIINELFYQITNAGINYCVKPFVGSDEIHIAIWKKYKEYKDRTLINMSSNRLDRHKLASCICGAIIETKPLVGHNGATILKNANEKFALSVGLNVIKYYMMYDLKLKLNISQEMKDALNTHLRDSFTMKLPSFSENICDTQEYHANLLNGLYWSHQPCSITKTECFRYDVWAYSSIFYHLELYNSRYMQKACNEFLNSIK